MKYTIFILILVFFSIRPVYADIADRDGDGISDKDETEIYFTSPDNADTDGDGYNDWIELNNGFSPFTAGIRLEEGDFDQDGLSDNLECHFKVDPVNPDTDGDGLLDGAEVLKGYNPAQAGADAVLEKRINIDTKNQLISYYTGDVRLGLFVVSTGKRGWDTPAGEFRVIEKNPRRWSRLARLWMPYWLMFDGRGYGIHELPEWPNGVKEGQNHLGTPVSHGCVRLGVGPAEELYNFAELGTKVYVN